MRAGLLYSAGKDSTLAALLLDDFYDVTLVTASFGVVDPDPAREAAAALGFPHETVELDQDVAHDAVERMHDDGYPRNGIQRVHEHAVERVAAGDAWDAVADGSRRDDRVPTIDRPLAQSVEDRFGVDYLAPLAGIGRGAIDDMVVTGWSSRPAPVSRFRRRITRWNSVRCWPTNTVRGPSTISSPSTPSPGCVVGGDVPSPDGRRLAMLRDGRGFGQARVSGCFLPVGQPSPGGLKGRVGFGNPADVSTAGRGAPEAHSEARDRSRRGLSMPSHPLQSCIWPLRCDANEQFQARPHCTRWYVRLRQGIS